ncbi:hypothetical protein NEIG_02440 [Nematocida sp. ERTm5]|nr:hypothetical protein NEIG_02440 [Nematocida sp. ERTm5]
MEHKLYNEIGFYVRERIDKRIPLKEFLNHELVNLPTNLEEIKSRIIINYYTMCGNYILILCLFLCLFLVFHPILIIPAGICFFLFYTTTENSDDCVKILGTNYTKVHIYCMAVGVPVVFFIFMPNSLVSLFFTVTLSIILCIAHMVVYKPPAGPEEEDI